LHAAEADREFRPVTIARRASAIAATHRAQDHPNPCDSGAVAAVMSGIRREHGTVRYAEPSRLSSTARAADRTDRNRHARRPARPGVATARVRRRAASRARRT
jgi:hypothetical protein